MKSLGLVFSGGGVRALAHAGLLQVLEEEGLRPSLIAGTSGGALVGALYAAGHAPRAIADFFRRAPIFKASMVNLGSLSRGLVNSAKYPEFFADYFPADRFEALGLPLVVTATNLLSGTLHYFHSGELIKPLIATAALPPYFSPVAIGDGLYCDGGVLNNFPVEALAGRCTVRLGSFINPLETIDAAALNNPLKFMRRLYDVALDSPQRQKFGQCDLVCCHEMAHIGVLNVQRLDEAFQSGYNLTRAQLPRLRALLAD